MRPAARSRLAPTSCYLHELSRPLLLGSGRAARLWGPGRARKVPARLRVDPPESGDLHTMHPRRHVEYHRAGKEHNDTDNARVSRRSANLHDVVADHCDGGTRTRKSGQKHYTSRHKSVAYTATRHKSQNPLQTDWWQPLRHSVWRLLLGCPSSSQA